MLMHIDYSNIVRKLLCIYTFSLNEEIRTLNTEIQGVDEIGGNRFVGGIIPNCTG